MRRLLPIAAALLVLGAAGTWWIQGHLGPPAPLPADLDEADTDVAALIRSAAEAVDARPGDADRRLRLGLIYEANSYFDDAVRCYEQVLARDAGRAVAWYRLAMCRERAGDFQGAIAAMRRAIERASGYAPAFVRLALWQLDAGEVDEAHSAIERARALAPGARGHHVAQARLHLERNEAREAIAVIAEHGLTDGPTAPYAAHLLATAHRMVGEPEAARRALDAVGGLPASSPGIEDPWTDELQSLTTGLAAKQRRVGSLMRAGRHVQALQLLEPMIAADPGDVRLHGMLAQCYLATRRPDDALRVAREAVGLEPDHYGSNLSFARVSLALAGRGADLDEALLRVEHAIELRPTDGGAHQTRAEVLHALQRSEEAVGEWREAWRLDARDPSPLLRLGFVQLDRGEWEAARATFDELLGSFRDDALHFIGRARAQMELGELDSAERTLAEAEAAPIPNPAVLNATRTRLAELRAAQNR